MGRGPPHRMNAATSALGARVRTTAVMTTRDLPGTSSGSLRVPALVAVADAGDETLVLVHDHRPRPAGGSWRSLGGALPDDLPNPDTLWLRRSEDAGEHWSAPLPLAPPPELGVRGVSDPSLLHDPATGTLHLFAAASTDVGLFGAHPPRRPSPDETGPAGPPEPGTLRLLHASSPDGGARWTWRDLTDMFAPSPERPDGVVAFPVSGHGLAVGYGNHAGRLVQPLVSALAPRSDGTRPVRALALLSDDAGRTWFPGEDVPAPAVDVAASLAGGTATSGVDEWALAETVDPDDGGAVLLLAARDGGYGGTRLTALSRDAGRTWSVPHPEPDLPDPGCNGVLVVLPDGAVACAHASHPRERCGGRLSVLSGTSWSSGPSASARWSPAAALTGPDEPFGYCDAAVLPRAAGGGCLVVVAERPSPEATDLVCLRVAL